MKVIRYVPQGDITRATLAVSETGVQVEVTPDGYETTCPHEIRALDGYEAVVRAPESRAPRTPRKED